MAPGVASGMRWNLTIGRAGRAQRGLPEIAREDGIMIKAPRMISVSAFVAPAALGTGGALGPTLSNSRTKTSAAVSESAKASEAPTVSPDRKNAQPTDSSAEYDRSDLLLSQGWVAGSTGTAMCDIWS